jgi:hypothetical protein
MLYRPFVLGPSSFSLPSVKQKRSFASSLTKLLLLANAPGPREAPQRIADGYEGGHDQQQAD